MDTHIFKGPFFIVFFMSSPLLAEGRAVFLPNFHSILIHPTISLAQNPRAHQAEGINSPGSPIIALLPSNFITLFEIQVMMQECMDAAEALLS
ncbi:hypothetical protein SDJN02_11902, partial [Cucurbita argyrosperma subsp. argyrosperma]